MDITLTPYPYSSLYPTLPHPYPLSSLTPILPHPSTPLTPTLLHPYPHSPLPPSPLPPSVAGGGTACTPYGWRLEGALATGGGVQSAPEGGLNPQGGLASQKVAGSQKGVGSQKGLVSQKGVSSKGLAIAASSPSPNPSAKSSSGKPLIGGKTKPPSPSPSPLAVAPPSGSSKSTHAKASTSPISPTKQSSPMSPVAAPPVAEPPSSSYSYKAKAKEGEGEGPREEPIESTNPNQSIEKPLLSKPPIGGVNNKEMSNKGSTSKEVSNRGSGASSKVKGGRSDSHSGASASPTIKQSVPFSMVGSGSPIFTPAASATPSIDGNTLSDDEEEEEEDEEGNEDNPHRPASHKKGERRTSTSTTSVATSKGKGGQDDNTSDIIVKHSHKATGGGDPLGLRKNSMARRSSGDHTPSPYTLLSYPLSPLHHFLLCKSHLSPLNHTFILLCITLSVFSLYRTVTFPLNPHQHPAHQLSGLTTEQILTP